MSIGNKLLSGPALVLGECCEHRAQPAEESLSTGALRAAANVLGQPRPGYHLVAGDSGKMQKRGYSKAQRALPVRQDGEGGKTKGRGRGLDPRESCQPAYGWGPGFGSRRTAASSRKNLNWENLTLIDRAYPQPGQRTNTSVADSKARRRRFFWAARVSGYLRTTSGFRSGSDPFFSTTCGMLLHRKKLVLHPENAERGGLSLPFLFIIAYRVSR